MPIEWRVVAIKLQALRCAPELVCCHWNQGDTIALLFETYKHENQALLESYLSAPDQCRSLIGEASWQRFLSYENQEARDEFLASRIVVSRICEVLSSADEQIKLVATTFQQPYLQSSEGRKYSVSWTHSCGIVVVALNRNHVIGIDLELGEPLPLDLNVLEQLASPEELVWLRRAEVNGCYKKSFRALWQAKEALLKADGRGGALNLSRVNLALPDGELLESVRLPPHTYSVNRQALGDIGFISLAVRTDTVH